METVNQSYWHTEYQFHKNYTVDTNANNKYQKYAKKAFHRARRRHDKELIEEEIEHAIDIDPWLVDSITRT